MEDEHEFVRKNMERIRKELKQNEQKKVKSIMAKIMIVGIVAIVGIPIALFIGKTSIVDGNFKVERPLTAMLFYATLMAAMIEDKLLH